MLSHLKLVSETQTALRMSNVSEEFVEARPLPARVNLRALTVSAASPDDVNP